MGNIEFVHGQESHSSSWGKFYIKGLEAFQTKEDFTENRNDKHHNYNGYVCNDVPVGTIFTVFEQSGDKRGTDIYEFAICEISNDEANKWKPSYGSGKLIGNYRIVTIENTKTKAPRLMDWWINSRDKSLAFAKWCDAHINKRGIKELPPMATPSTAKRKLLKEKIASLEAELIACKQELSAIADS